MPLSMLVGTLLLLASAAGALLLLWAVALVGRGGPPTPVDIHKPPVTILKPLNGSEPRLLANLSSLLDQDYPSPVQILCGVRSSDDGAVTSVRELAMRACGTEVALVVNPCSHGSNAKVSTLINLMDHVKHDVLILSDSDISVDRQYIDRVVGALSAPGVGAVSCLYRGRGDAGTWSGLCAMAIDLYFMPSVLIGLGTGLAKPCMGSTIAMHRSTLERIGGFAAVASTLADDHAIGAAISSLGLSIAIPDMPVTHACDDKSLAELLRHELRWQATIAGIDPAGHAGSAVLHPAALAVVAGLLIGFGPLVLSVFGAAIGARLAFAWRLQRFHGRATQGLVLLPLREALSFGVFVASFFVRTVAWRGNRLRMGAGRAAAVLESVP